VRIKLQGQGKGGDGVEGGGGGEGGAMNVRMHGHRWQVQGVQGGREGVERGSAREV
jgi:hypothetical protein